ncbi:tRNA nucleotidyltransferase (CCA-adding enzyme) [Anaeroplasma bactoclasticum]|uniref:tRNA nucleotidyltransferase (CCA-adding enzyme) n=1 Tax=Anaeroplasma bactoclasticum TaxID=2088 RepID=A0A397RVC8_9MOLU|nr:HD domain-containing protein [Anaeroplasma bactoclasticum]RIA78300.1 tRNA nucleotidyltransferase (CCA-adding enzyme) [Anaeroplasma bactoclasticum]
MDSFEINPNILYAISLLESHGYQAYLVGGAVRDFLLDLEVSDYDIATNATLDQAIEVFKEFKCKKYISKNITIGVKLNHTYFELSSFKGSTIEEDLSNRDFTVNSMAYHPKYGLIDPYHGLSDLVSKRLKTVKDIEEVFTYDPNRILRAIRFHATRGLIPTLELKMGINKYSYLLNEIKSERVGKEIDPILLTETPSFYIREYISVFSTLFPELGKCIDFDQKCPKWHNLDVLSHILKVLDSTKCDLTLRYAAFFHDIAKPMSYFLDDKGVGHFYGHAIKSEEYARVMLEKYTYNHHFIDRVCHLIYYHDYPIEDTDKSVLDFLYKFGIKDLDLYLGLKRADILGQNPDLYYRLDKIDSIQERIKRLLEEERIITYKNLKINGDILQGLGYEAEEIGKALRIILNKVIKRELKNDEKKLYNYACELKYHLNEIE